LPAARRTTRSFRQRLRCEIDGRAGLHNLPQRLHAHEWCC
jgi:hypothetical protein